MPILSVEDRIQEAYIAMARQAGYRPEASEGADPDDDLEQESCSYAKRFIAEEQTSEFHIGISDYTTNRALVYTIEAARLLCGRALGVNHALKLLEMALIETRAQLPNYPPLPQGLRGARLI